MYCKLFAGSTGNLRTQLIWVKFGVAQHAMLDSKVLYHIRESLVLTDTALVVVLGDDWFARGDAGLEVRPARGAVDAIFTDYFGAVGSRTLELHNVCRRIRRSVLEYG